MNCKYFPKLFSYLYLRVKYFFLLRGINYNSILTVTIGDRVFCFSKNAPKLMNKVPREECFNLHILICIIGQFSLQRAYSSISKNL